MALSDLAFVHFAAVGSLRFFAPAVGAFLTATSIAGVSTPAGSVMKSRSDCDLQSRCAAPWPEYQIGRACVGKAPPPPDGSQLLVVSHPAERDDLSSNRHSALHYWWSMIFSENRCPLFGIML